MCGICGKLVLDESGGVDRDLLKSMMDSMRHRGPDDEGMYLSGPVGLGHRRLSIIDLSTGRQPISNEDGTLWIVFNGEIYNYKELTAYLASKGHSFRTSTDTEVIVHLYEECGEACVTKLRGMFSFAIWNSRNRELFLARDRVGIKPLYYHLSPEALIFASEIKAILKDPSIAVEVDPSVLAIFMSYRYVPGEGTLFKNVYKLSPGHYLTVKAGKVSVEKYWDLRFEPARQARTFDMAREELIEYLRSTVRDHMISDVPVGVLLSGGVDSTAMLSFAVQQADRPLSTFTIGFEDRLCTDERPFAKIAAAKFGTEHHEMTITAKNFLDFLPKYAWHMEEPVCEPPAVALYYVSKLAKDCGVSVLISGEGGDEAFAGYQTYRNLVWLERMKRCAGPLAGPASGVATAVGKVRQFRRLAKYAPLMNVPLARYYYSRTSNPFSWFNRNREALYTPEFLSGMNGHNPSEFAAQCFRTVAGLPVLDQMLYVDTKTWLPDELLIKADKMTMANSLELRVPLLDHRVLEFAASLPASYKVRGITTKHILKEALSQRIPGVILNRKKTGFPVPYSSWIRNELKGVTWSILTDRRTVERGYFRKSAIEQLLGESSAGEDRADDIFSLLALELWHRAFVDRQTVS